MDSYTELWEHVLNHIQETSGFSQATFNLWFKDLVLLKLTDTTAYIAADKDYKVKFIFTRFMHVLENSLCEITGDTPVVVILSKEKHGANLMDIIEKHIETGQLPENAVSSGITKALLNEQPLSESERKSIDSPQGTIIKSEIPPVKGKDGYTEEYTFDNFIVGSTNKFAHAACLAIANNPSKTYNPLFIHGPSGLGKTHLLYAITNEILRSGKASTVLYVRGEDFTNQLVNSLIQKKPMHYFREKYRSVDVLLVDDIQFIAGKDSTQEEFFHTFNALHEQNKQIILTSDRPPKDIKTLEDRLKSRFEWGLIVDIQPPDLELRIAILKSKSEALGIQVPDDVILYLAEQIKSNIRQLEGAVKKLNAYSFISGVPIDLKLTKLCLQDILTGDEPLSVTVDKIFAKVSEKYGVSIDEIKSRKRQKEIVIARHVCTYILRQLTDLSSIEIARFFDQDHSSILSAIKNVEEKIKISSAFESDINELISDIKV